MPKGSEDYRKGKLLPDPVVPASTVCFHITIPNAVQYRAALVGVISQLTNWYTWDHPTDGTECVDCNTAAEMFAKALEESYYDEECGDDMSCADVADCIENDAGVQQALNNVVPAVPIDGMVFPPGVPLTPSQMTQRLNEIDACAFDPYWAQVEQYVNYMIDLGQDVLDQIALYNAALDAGENIPMGKFLGKLKNTSGGGKVIEFLQWVVTTVKAAYEAADNTANRDAIKCAIFCQFRDDCLITIQGTLDVLNERNGGLLTPGDLEDLPAMIDAFLMATFNPALALDLWLMFLMGSAKTAGMFGLQGIDETIQLVLEVAVNDANNDWETKCDDCDDPPPPDPNCQDFTIDDYDWNPEAGSVYIPSTGFTGDYNVSFNTTALRALRGSVSGTINKVVAIFAIPQTDVFLQAGDGSLYFPRSGTLGTDVEFSAATMGGGWVNWNAALGMRVGANMVGNQEASGYLVGVCVYFEE